jgi:hypothetical protein
LTENSQLIWGGNRPSALFWIAIEQDGVRRVLSGGNANDIVSKIEQRSDYLGLPLYLPVMDLQDEQSIALSDLWGLFMEPIEEASVRYQPDAVVAMQLYESSLGQWKGRWSMISNDKSFSQPVIAESPEKAVEGAIDNVSSILASQYAVLGQDSTLADRLEIEVSGIDSYSDYVDLFNYVEALSPVLSAQVSWVRESTVRLTVKISGSIEKFEQHVSLDSVLKTDFVNIQSPTDTFRLFYEWQGV